MKKILLLVTVFFYLCTGAVAEINIPHLTGGVSDWQDVLTIDNLSDRVEKFKVILYRNGEQSFSKDYYVSPYSSVTANIKDLDFYADCGVILPDGADLTCFRCRIAYRSAKGGVAEFALNGDNKSQLSFNFSNTFTDIVQWKGIAVMNSGFKPQDVTLYALGKGRVLGVASDSIAPRSKILGAHTVWFPNVDINNIESIIVTSLNAPLAGVTISGNFESSKLLFTPAALVTSFKDLNNPDMQLAKRLIGTWTFLESTEYGENQQSYMFLRIDSFDGQNNSYELLALQFWALAENVKAYYKAGRKYYTLQYEYVSTNGKRYTKKYEFTFVSDYSIQGSIKLYDSQGGIAGTAALYGLRSGSVKNNNGDEDLSLNSETSTQSPSPFLKFQ